MSGCSRIPTFFPPRLFIPYYMRVEKIVFVRANMVLSRSVPKSESKRQARRPFSTAGTRTTPFHFLPFQGEENTAPTLLEWRKNRYHSRSLEIKQNNIKIARDGSSSSRILYVPC
ncbi:hypothetical protein NPIL_22371 [Nephila pilipes]|uniref:Uncharacterized protein n=1 Tax=Nephila pilipes TaxID=299642 RepID=A0A8X6QGR1_NEPPI|nr:hypothetical protein NPIL_22371 [Nephila pilipes]